MNSVPEMLCLAQLTDCTVAKIRKTAEAFRELERCLAKV